MEVDDMLMKNTKKLFITSLLVGLLATPYSQATHAKVPTVSTKTKLIVGGCLCAGAVGVAATAAAAYYIATNRPSMTEPTPIDFECFGDEEGQPIIHSHGLGRFGKTAYCYTEERNPHTNFYIFDPEIHHVATFNYPDPDIQGDAIRGLKYDQVSLAQEGDVTRLNEAVNLFGKQNIVAYGVSRGAATLINMMGTEKNPSISAMILEAPFSSIEDATEHIFKQKSVIGNVPLIGKIAHVCTPIVYPQYSCNGIQPIDTINQIDPEIPILLIHSTADKTCPIDGARKLYIKRKEQGCDNIYFVELEEIRHGMGLFNEISGEFVQNLIHAFYKKFGFAHNSALADGINLDGFQPSIEEVQARIDGEGTELQPSGG